MEGREEGGSNGGGKWRASLNLLEMTPNPEIDSGVFICLFCFQYSLVQHWLNLEDKKQVKASKLVSFFF